MHRLYNSYNKTQGHSPFQRQDDFRRGKKKKMFMNGYSEESFYAREISLDFFFFLFFFFLAP